MRTRAHARVYAHAYTFYHGSSNTKTFGFASLVFELCSFSRFLLFCLLGVRALRCFIKTPCFLVLCLNFNTYTAYRKKKWGKSSTCSSKMTSLGLFFACLLFELSSVRANVVRRVGKCVLCVQYVCTVWVLCVLCVGTCVRIGNFKKKLLQKKFWENVKEYTKIPRKRPPLFCSDERGRA